MQGHHYGTEPRIGDHFGLGVICFQRGILRIDLRLGLRESGVWFEPGDHLDDVSAGMPLQGRAIFRARCKGEEHAGIGREKAEGGRQDADHGSRNAVYTNLPSDHIGISVVSLPPKCVGKNGDIIGFRSGFFFCESASDRRAEPESREKIRRHAHGLLAFRRAGLTDYLGAIVIDRERGEGGNMTTSFVIVGQRRAVAVDAGFRIRIEYRHKPVWRGKWQRTEQDRVDHGKNR